ncbi:MAG: hypothetical protein WDN03_02445 [Rhizomicrobium sp.]
MFRALAIVLGIFLMATAASAQTCTFHVDQTTFPNDILGRAAYIDEDANILYIYDFKTGTRTQPSFTNSPAFTDIGNPVWTPDGQGIVFPAVQSDHWKLFYWKVSASPSAAVELATGGSRNEDPHFLPNGKKLVWKRDFGIATADVSPDGSGNPTLSNVVQVFTGSSGTNEYSGPVYSPTGKYIYYWKGVGADSQIARYETITATNVLYPKTSGLSFYYPQMTDLYDFFYTRWADTSERDTIYVYFGYSHMMLEWNAADCAASKADAAPADEDLFLYSRLVPNTGSPGSHFNLFLGRLSDGNSWSLPTANGSTDDNMVGANFTFVQSP